MKREEQRKLAVKVLNTLSVNFTKLRLLGVSLGTEAKFHRDGSVTISFRTYGKERSK